MMDDVPEGARRLLIAGLELAGAVLTDEPREVLESQALGIVALAHEHVDFSGVSDAA